MKRFVEFLATTIRGGFFVVLPIVLVLFLIGEAVGTLVALLEPIAHALPAHGVLGLNAPRLLALLLILGTCFLTGIVISTRLGARVTQRLEDLVLQRLPGYTMLKNLTQQFAGAADGAEFVPALARVHGGDAWSLCFVIEDHGDGVFTIFVPTSPTPTIGFVYQIGAAALHRLDTRAGPAVNCVMQWGVGLRELRGRRGSHIGGSAAPDAQPESPIGRNKEEEGR